jgi:hypothetical protein
MQHLIQWLAKVLKGQEIQVDSCGKLAVINKLGKVKQLEQPILTGMKIQQLSEDSSGW